MFNHVEWSRYLSQAMHTLSSARRDIVDSAAGIVAHLEGEVADEPGPG